MKLGARILKTGLVVVLTLVITHAFNIGPAILAVIAAVTALQPSLKKSVEYIIQQIEANAIGIACAIAAILILGNDPITISLVVMVSIVLNLRLKLEKNIPVSIVTILSMMETTSQNVFLFGLERFGMTMLGGTIALVINHAFATRNYEQKLNTEFGILDQKTQLTYKSLMSKHVRGKRIRQEIKEFEEHVTNTKAVFSFYYDDYYWVTYKKKGSIKKLLLLRKLLSMYESTHDLLQLYLQNRTKLYDTNRNDKYTELSFKMFELQQKIFSMVTGFTYLNDCTTDFEHLHELYTSELDEKKLDVVHTHILHAMYKHLQLMESTYNVLRRYGDGPQK